MKQSRIVFWLKGASAFTVAFGLLMAAAASARFAAPMEFLLDLVFFPLDRAQSLHDPAIRLLNAICGGIMAGWGVAIWLTAQHLVPREPALARQILLASLCTWFLVDSTGSIVSGGHWNVLGNVGFLLLFLVPVLQLPRQVPRSA